MPGKELTTAAAEPTRDDGAIQVETTLPVRPRRHESGKGAQAESVSVAGGRERIPRVTRLMALAIKFQGMVDRSEVRDYADLARLTEELRARLKEYGAIGKEQVFKARRGAAGRTPRRVMPAITNPAWWSNSIKTRRDLSAAKRP